MLQPWDEDADDTADLQDLTVDSYLVKSIDIDADNLDAEFTRTASDLCYWNERYSAANRSYLRAKVKHSEVYSEQLLIIKEKLSGTKVTVDELKALVTTDMKVRAAHLALVETEAEKVAMRCRADSVAAKRDMLQSLGAKLRAEIMSDPALREVLLAGKQRG